ncbi:MAG: FeoB-associated Cys-rich membrane protein [Ruminococcaceae bacterium]|nr:FeoB-associated Cys-rich membrane protein [Oscillospiraceae bacterium]
MLQFISENMASFIAGAIVLAIVVAIVWKMVADKKKGRSSCGAGCAQCPNSQYCHPQKKQEQ